MGFSPCEYSGRTRNQCDPVTLNQMIVTCNIIQQPTSSNPFGGRLSIIILGGTSPYTIKWSDSNVTTATRFGLREGSYTATVTDYYGDFSTTVTCSLVEEYSCVCPPGFEIVNDECVRTTNALTGNISNTGYTAGLIGKTQTTVFGEQVFFYEEITNKRLPLTFFNNCKTANPQTGCTVDPGQSSYLVDATNWTPSLVSSYFGYYDVNISGSPIAVVASADTTNSLWCSTGSTSTGRMNNIGIKAYYGGTNYISSDLNQWIGVTFCLDLPLGLYHIFVGGDDSFSLEWNQNWLIKRCNNSTLQSGKVFNDGSLDRRDVFDKNVTFNYNHVLPITLSGENNFTIYWSDVGKGKTNGSFELYSGVTTSQLTAFTTTAQLDPYIVASTLSYSGQGIVRNLISPPCGSDRPDYGYYCTNGYQLLSACTTPVCKITIPCSNDLT